MSLKSVDEALKRLFTRKTVKEPEQDRDETLASAVQKLNKQSVISTILGSIASILSIIVSIGGVILLIENPDEVMNHGLTSMMAEVLLFILPIIFSAIISIYTDYIHKNSLSKKENIIIQLRRRESVLFDEIERDISEIIGENQ